MFTEVLSIIAKTRNNLKWDMCYEILFRKRNKKKKTTNIHNMDEPQKQCAEARNLDTKE